MVAALLVSGPVVAHAAAPVTVSSANELRTALAGTADVHIVLGADITTGSAETPDRMATGAGASITIDLSGKALTLWGGLNNPVGNNLIITDTSDGGGGTLTADSQGTWAAGIGGDPRVVGGSVTVSGGSVTATGGDYGAGIGGGYAADGGSVAVNGGSVIATGGSNGAGIGGGGGVDMFLEPDIRPAGGSVTVSGGSVVATGGYLGAGIGGGKLGSGAAVTVSGGSVTATGGAGIGGGLQGDGGPVALSGGTVTAAASSPDGKPSAVGGGGRPGTYRPVFGSLSVSSGAVLSLGSTMYVDAGALVSSQDCVRGRIQPADGVDRVAIEAGAGAGVQPWLSGVVVTGLAATIVRFEDVSMESFTAYASTFGQVCAPELAEGRVWHSAADGTGTTFGADTPMPGPVGDLRLWPLYATTTMLSCPAEVVWTGAPVQPCTAEVFPADAGTVGVDYQDNVATGTATATATFPGALGYVASSSDPATFTILPLYTVSEFSSPVEPGGTVTVRSSGSTLPLRFTVADADAAVTSTSALGAGFWSAPADCATGTVTGAVSELPVSTKNFQYNGGSFQYLWKTPKKTGCYQVGVTLPDGSGQTALVRIVRD